MKEFITKYNNLQEDLQIVEDLSGSTLEKICKQTHISETDWIGVKHFDNDLSKEQMDALYNFAYTKGIPLNEIRHHMLVDMYQKGDTKVLVHGARNSIKGEIDIYRQKYDKEVSLDFGYGFYLGDNLDQAGCWVANEPNACLYTFLFNPKGLVEAKFELNAEWFIAVAYCRHELPEEYLDTPMVRGIANKIDNCDFVTGPIADNALFDIIKQFIDGEITDKQATYSMATTHLGFQRVLKTDKCLDNLELVDHLFMCSLEKAEYLKLNEDEMETSRIKSEIAMTKFKDKGSYIHELLEEVGEEPKRCKLKFSLEGVGNAMIVEKSFGDTVDLRMPEYQLLADLGIKINWYLKGNSQSRPVGQFKVTRDLAFIGRMVSPPTFYKIDGSVLYLSNNQEDGYTKYVANHDLSSITELQAPDGYVFPYNCSGFLKQFGGEVLDLRRFNMMFVGNAKEMFSSCLNLKELKLPLADILYPPSEETQAIKVYPLYISPVLNPKTVGRQCTNMFSNCPKLEMIEANPDWALQYNINDVVMFDGDESLPHYAHNKVTGKYARYNYSDTVDSFGYGYFTYIPIN